MIFFLNIKHNNFDIIFLKNITKIKLLYIIFIFCFNLLFCI